MRADGKQTMSMRSTGGRGVEEPTLLLVLTRI
jgi:hypothetical protein